VATQALHHVPSRGRQISARRPLVESRLPAGQRHRRDIQGLRALAVLSVALNHAEVPGLPGGYVGVDVFFVISGYLITQLLLREVQHEGHLSLGRFYGRRARRILPAATLVLVVTVLASSLLMGFVRAAAVVRDSIWAAAFAANVKFSHDETNYFSADSPPSPLRHFWSLAVEEQFYLVWPVLLAALVAASAAVQRHRSSTGPHRRDPARIVAMLAAVVVGASLLWSIASSYAQPQAAYFSTPARAYEFGIGAGLAAVATWTARWSSLVRAVLGWLGLLGVVVAIVRFDAHTVFPGYTALLPVLGTALLIAAGEAPTAGAPQRLLGMSVGQHIGAWSYSFYLWHWPVLVIAAAYAGHPLSVAQNLALLAAALATSAVTYHVVENPFRRAKMLSKTPWRGVAVYPLALAVTLAGCAAAHEVIDREVARASQAPPITLGTGPVGDRSSPAERAVALVAASAEAARDGRAVPGRLSPSLLQLDDSLADTGDCDYSEGRHDLCRLGDPSGLRTMVVLGDSHARAWIPALEPLARRTGFAAYYLVKPGCNAGLFTPDLGFGPFTGCVEWRDWALDQAKSLEPDLVLIASDLPPGYLDEDTGETVTDQAAVADAVSRGMVATVDALRAEAARFAIIGDAPGLAKAPGECLSTRGADLGDCAFPQTEKSRLLLDAERRAAEQSGADFVDTMSWFCADDLCPSVIGSTIAYRDTEHVTTEYSVQLTRPLQAALGLHAHAHPLRP
jgi:peptidoglycan/LPS O-acetylase OafA/YrhL